MKPLFLIGFYPVKLVFFDERKILNNVDKFYERIANMTHFMTCVDETQFILPFSENAMTDEIFFLRFILE
jgi:hypothetical protein